jgi:hypothetical protein
MLMPVHDWTRVNAGTFHHFHSVWIPEISKTLNDGLLPADYYAMAEQVAGEVAPDVLTLHVENDTSHERPAGRNGGAVAVAEAPPKVSLVSQSAESLWYAAQRKQLVIRHGSDDEVVAFLGIVSPGNKSNRRTLEQFVDKVWAALNHGISVLIVDVHPPGPRDPTGIHGAIWDTSCDEPYHAPSGKPMTLAAYHAAPVLKAYVEPIGLGSALADMPLFLDTYRYVNVPLEATYTTAYAAVPARWRNVIEQA